MKVFVSKLVVAADEIDPNNHVNNLAYLKWMQDSALAHSTAEGWPLERYLTERVSWVARKHTIEYLKPAFLNEELKIETWVSEIGNRSSVRKYRCIRDKDQTVLSVAETLWVCVDMSSGKPIEIPDKLRSSFEVVPEESVTR